MVSLAPTRESEPVDDSESLPLVGATDVSRRRAILRATGEAVERWALRPSPWSGPTFERGRRVEWAQFGLANHDLGRKILVGKNISTSEPITIPIELVEYDQANTGLARAAQGNFEPTPSGAAAGETLDQAVVSGVLELLERDAFMVAWARQLRIERIDAHTVGSVGGANPIKLVDLARRMGLELVVGNLGCDVDGVKAIIAICLDRSAQLGAVGSKASTSVANAVEGAIQESLQALHLGRVIRRAVEGGQRTTSGLPRTEMDRARYWSGTDAYAVLDRWTQSFVNPSSIGGPASRPTPTPLESTIRCGFEPIVLDLSARLPARVREIGWHAVKVLCPGLQPLRLDETLSFSWLPSRLLSAERRTGYASPLAEGEVFDVPHPLV
ncbi:YcaO-like family protein [Rathayibacter iranicus]|nr:YcaO-like family protein [Rathayibacter iranicus]